MTKNSRNVAIIGGGPAGLMAADQLLSQGYQVTLYEAKPSLARKFQLAGRGGLNLTHSEPLEDFVKKYGEHAVFFEQIIKNHSPAMLQDFCKNLGQDTFVGTSGRVFPVKFKATELLRAWINDLVTRGVILKLRHRWLGFGPGQSISVAIPDGSVEQFSHDAVILALGGGSWPRMGSDGSWVEILKSHNIRVNPLKATNCGFETNWPSSFSPDHFGKPLKNIEVCLGDCHVKGEIMIASYGLEGGAIYALSKEIRTRIEEEKVAQITIDLKPLLSLEGITQKLLERNISSSVAAALKQSLKIPPPALALLKAFTTKEEFNSPALLAQKIKRLPIKLARPRPLDRAISTAGGVPFTECDEQLMLKALPGVFLAGEMLDWEAPTGGYLLQGCFSMGVHVAAGIDTYLATKK
ncbi:TIGR03862 family flavoprotein [Kiloniella laminariae]|uniref:TIGR03862 family flavoprotein n=1 Tax=Kiloniella laminariae TaxID=454162 RepID=A0ABT4LLE4_9PROT|nr:TIGR03862 family flavoprotein [Kiloniella laminariae]MCZ4281932.1 TIGR03862 family flavoprotein [Kiloniella laminariae]